MRKPRCRAISSTFISESGPLTLANVTISLFGLLLFAAGFSQFVRNLKAAQLGWLAFASLIIVVPWLPASAISFGGARLELLRKQAAASDVASAKELRTFEASVAAQLNTQREDILSLQEAPSKRTTQEALTMARRLAEQAGKAQSSYLAAAREADAARKAVTQSAGKEPGVGDDQVPEPVTIGPPCCTPKGGAGSLDFSQPGNPLVGR